MLTILTSEARRRDATMADTVLSAVLALSPGEGKKVAGGFLDASSCCYTE